MYRNGENTQTVVEEWKEKVEVVRLELRNVFADKQTMQAALARGDSAIGQLAATQKAFGAKMDSEVLRDIRELKDEMAAQREMILGASRLGSDQQTHDEGESEPVAEGKVEE